MIYFDNGATTYPKPRRVLRAVQEAMDKYGANPGRSGHKMAMDTALRVFAVREAFANFFGAEQPEHVVFGQNATHTINLALKGTLKQGDHIVISDLEHNAVLRPVHTLAQRGIITYSIAQVDPNDDAVTAANFSRLIRPNTKMIACTHASNVFGIKLPVKRLGHLAAERDLLFLVDAAQTAGVLDIDIKDARIDFLCAAGHKSLYGPSGTGLLVTPLGGVLDTIIEGGTGSFSADYVQPDIMPDRLESGTVNTIGIIGLGKGLEFVRERTPAALLKHETMLAREAYRHFARTNGVKLYTAEPAVGKNLPVLSFNVGELHSEEIAEQLSRRGIAVRAGLHCAPLAHEKMGTLESGTVRVSIGAFNTLEEIHYLCEIVKKITQKHCNTTGIW